MATGLLWDERFAWHDIGSLETMLQAPLMQPGGQGETPESKRRIRNLLEVTGLLDDLVALKASEATDDDLHLCHAADYVSEVRRLSAAQGGIVGPAAWIGPGGFETARLAVGGAIVAMESVLSGRTPQAYALVRPPGHHAGPTAGGGICIFNNLSVAIRVAQKKYGVGRVAVVDWDAHHGNGTEAIFWEDPSVLTISLHQDRYYPGNVGLLEHIGAGTGEGYNINIPLPPGAGDGAYRAAFERVVSPALMSFKPEVIVVACGFDAGAMDFSARLMLHSESFRFMTRLMIDLAEELCGGRMMLCHEGGYQTATVPFHALTVFEELCGRRTGIEDPFLFLHQGFGGQELQPHQDEVVRGAEQLVRRIR